MYYEKRQRALWLSVGSYEIRYSNLKASSSQKQEINVKISTLQKENFRKSFENTRKERFKRIEGVSRER